MTTENKKILRINALVSALNDGQIAVEPTADPDLGFKMFGGMDYDSVATKFLAKDKNARVATLPIGEATST